MNHPRSGTDAARPTPSRRPRLQKVEGDEASQHRRRELRGGAREKSTRNAEDGTNGTPPRQKDHHDADDLLEFKGVQKPLRRSVHSLMQALWDTSNVHSKSNPYQDNYRTQ